MVYRWLQTLVTADAHLRVQTATPVSAAHPQSALRQSCVLLRLGQTTACLTFECWFRCTMACALTHILHGTLVVTVRLEALHVLGEVVCDPVAGRVRRPQAAGPWRSLAQAVDALRQMRMQHLPATHAHGGVSKHEPAWEAQLRMNSPPCFA
jgi:hypothetical protein